MARKEKARFIRFRWAIKLRINAESEEEAAKIVGDMIADEITENFQTFIPFIPFLQSRILTFGVRGNWWGPEKPDSQIKGTLKWSNRKSGGWKEEPFESFREADYEPQFRYLYFDTRGKFTSRARAVKVRRVPIKRGKKR